MHHATPLITTLVGGLVLAFILGMLANRLRISPLVGYLLAGVVAGPFTPGFVADTKLAPELAELGVILLMFGVGLHFSLKDLMAVKSIAIPGAILQIAVATLLGAGLSTFLGWSLMTGIVFGLCLSTASTVVLLRALEERQLIESQRGQIAIGWLIVEDLVMVLTLVLLPAVAGMLEKGDLGLATLSLDMGITLGKVGAEPPRRARYAAAARCLRGAVFRLGRDAVRPDDSGSATAGGAGHAADYPVRQIDRRVCAGETVRPLAPHRADDCGEPRADW